jgi:hypothetical protein
MYPVQANLKQLQFLYKWSTEFPEQRVHSSTENRSTSNRNETKAGRHYSWLKELERLLVNKSPVTQSILISSAYSNCALARVAQISVNVHKLA